MVIIGRMKIVVYSILKKNFQFLIDEFGFEIVYKQKLGFIQITYMNSDIRVTILGDEYIRVLISDADSLGTCYDVTEYSDEFKIDGSYSEKAVAAAQWLKNKLNKELV
jgi:hypothetical protein